MSRADDAEQIINNPVFREAFDSVRDTIIQQLRTELLTEEQTIIKLTAALQAVDWVEDAIKGAIIDGQVAAFNSEMRKAIN